MKYQPHRLLVTAGPTHEPIDAVRFIGNRSSGRMGIALAQSADQLGWDVTLLLGPVSVAPPGSGRIQVQRFRTCADLQKLLSTHANAADILIMAAGPMCSGLPQGKGHEAQGRKTKRLLSSLVPSAIADP